VIIGKFQAVASSASEIQVFSGPIKAIALRCFISIIRFIEVAVFGGPSSAAINSSV